jgi:hypothetical protein
MHETTLPSSDTTHSHLDYHHDVLEIGPTGMQIPSCVMVFLGTHSAMNNMILTILQHTPLGSSVIECTEAAAWCACDQES